MNNKIYFNSNFIEFVETNFQNSSNQGLRFYSEFSEGELFLIINELLSENRVELSKNTIRIYTPATNFEQVLDYLKKKLYFIEACGGIVQKRDELLLMFRLGKWDLPKGKLDKGETYEECAVRECEEECAVSRLKIKKKIGSTFHVYKYKKSHALKESIWFHMTTDHAEKLIPQTEENIEEVKWMGEEEIRKTAFANSYPAIKDLLEYFLVKFPLSPKK
jgi:8-oxo-dGTP pyrophosphatase MutT (NUDIX family)